MDLITNAPLTQPSDSGADDFHIGFLGFSLYRVYQKSMTFPTINEQNRDDVMINSHEPTIYVYTNH